MSNQSSGGLGILGLIGAAVLFLILRHFFPSLSRLFLIIGIITIFGVLALTALVMYFAFRKPKKKPNSTSGWSRAAYLLRTMRKRWPSAWMASRWP